MTLNGRSRCGFFVYSFTIFTLLRSWLMGSIFWDDVNTFLEVQGENTHFYEFLNLQ
jgi:hypothetical protein